jgi:3-hydroxybutyrate dehydrogenase
MSAELTPLDGTAALVTGGTSGIGAAIARALLRAGTPVAITGRDGDRASGAAQALQEETGTECAGFALDVTDDGSCADFVRALEGFRPIEWLVNNAGVAETMASASPGNLDLARRLMEVNFFGPMRLFAALAPGMLERGGGRVVQVASSASLQGYPYVSSYVASKHALMGWTRSAALECAPKGVGVSALCPHYVDTPMTDRSIETMREKTGRSEEDLRAFLAAQNPGGALVTVREVADAAMELLRSDRSGAVYELIGGSTAVIEEGVLIGAR